MSDGSSNGTSKCAGAVRKHTSVLNDLRTNVFVTLDKAWQQLLENGDVNDETLHAVTYSCHALARACRAAINETYPLCGMEALPRESERNRVWRNIHMALSHALFRKRMAVERY